MENQANNVSPYNKPSKFKLVAGGEQNVHNQLTIQPVRHYFDSADYFLNKYWQELKEQRNNEFEKNIEQVVDEQCEQMIRKYGTPKNKQILLNKKEKKVFDSADYFMSLQKQQKPFTCINYDELITQVLEEQEIMIQIKKSTLKKKSPLIKDNKKYFDSADYFMEQQVIKQK